jgi:two-component system phosphate regulon sensor histidine kinase PhoR
LIRQTAFRTFLKKEATSEPSTIQLTGGRVQRYVSLQIVSFGQNQKLLLAQDVTNREKLDTTRRDFIANVSHELRTPLTVIQGYLETFEEDPTEDPELLARGIELMSDQSRRMNRLVEDLLTLSRLETSDALQEETINVSGMLSAISHEAEALSKSNHRVHLDIEDGLDLIGSQDEIRSALTNLVSNAIRYSPNGGDINLCWYSNSDKAVFSCKDQGVGIDTQHIDRLTERFYRVDKSRSRETGGTGLGLAIVKHVLNRHGATLTISSVPGEGSTFSAIFPESRKKKL